MESILSLTDTLMFGTPEFIVLIFSYIILKGIVLWKAARLSHKWWFVIFLFVNTLGILEMIYYIFISRKYTVETETVSE